MTIKAAVLQTVPGSLVLLVNRIATSPLGYRLAKGAFWSLAGTVVSRGLALLAWILVPRMLGATAFGELGIIQGTVGLFATFAGLGLGLTATRYVAEFRVKDPARAGRIIAFSTLTATATGLAATISLLVLAPWLATNMLAAPHLAHLLRLSAVILFFGTVTGSQTGALLGFEAFKTIAAVNFSAGAVALPLIIGGVHLGGLEGAVWGLGLSMAINWLVNSVALRREASQAGIPLSYDLCWTERDVLWRFSFPVILTGVLVTPVNWVCAAMLVNRPGGYAELGIYNAAIQWQAALAFLPTLLSQVLLPILSDSHSNEGQHQTRKTLSTILGVFLAVTVLPAVVLAWAAPWIVVAYGESFQLPVRLFYVVVLHTTLANLGTALWICLLARNRAWFGFFGNLVWAACLLVSFPFLLPQGAFGLACANVLGYIVAMVVIFPPILRCLFATQKCAPS